MKKLFIVVMLVCLVGCGQDKLTFKSDSYGVSSKVVVYFEDGKATKALSETIFETKKEAQQEYERLKQSDIYLNCNLDNKTVTYEQKTYITGMTKEEVKAIFEEAEPQK